MRRREEWGGALRRMGWVQRGVNVQVGVGWGCLEGAWSLRKVRQRLSARTCDRNTMDR